jgi:hypothetical protein
MTVFKFIEKKNRIRTAILCIDFRYSMTDGFRPNSFPLSARVSDPHRFNADPDTDPDPVFFLIADPDSGSGSRLMT